jgi:hypothetical protein
MMGAKKMVKSNWKKRPNQIKKQAQKLILK